jgi:hypothetical protein
MKSGSLYHPKLYTPLAFIPFIHSFQKLFNDPDFYNKVMEEMAKELYKSLRKDEK